MLSKQHVVMALIITCQGMVPPKWQSQLRELVFDPIAQYSWSRLKCIQTRLCDSRRGLDRLLAPLREGPAAMQGAMQRCGPDSTMRFLMLVP